MNIKLAKTSFLLWLLLLVSIRALYTAPRPSPLDYSGQVAVLDKILDNQKQRYKLLALDLFEEKSAWNPRANSNMLSEIRTVRQTPIHDAFIQEKKIVTKQRIAASDLRHSLSIHTAFDIPGEQSWQLLHRHPVRLAGQLVRASLWIKSNNYKHSLYLLFRNASGREVRQYVSNLNWRGWRRIEVDLPAALYKRGNQIGHRYKHSFRGYLIRSNRKQIAGAMHIQLAGVLVLSDMHQLNYPGSEIQDSWGKINYKQNGK